MGIGVSIFLIAVGAILAFAVTVDLGGVSLDVVGYILMVAGLLGLAVAVWMNAQRTRTTHVVTEDRHTHGDHHR